MSNLQDVSVVQGSAWNYFNPASAEFKQLKTIFIPYLGGKKQLLWL